MRCTLITFLLTSSLAALLGVAGCSTSGPAFQEEAVTGDRALVYIFRESAVGGSASAFKIFANGEHITNMSNGGYYPYSAAAGKLELKAKIKANALNFGLGITFTAQPELALDVVGGETYFVQFEFGSLGGPKLKLVDRQVGLDKIRDCNKTEALL